MLEDATVHHRPARADMEGMRGVHHPLLGRAGEGGGDVVAVVHGVAVALLLQPKSFEPNCVVFINTEHHTDAKVTAVLLEIALRRQQSPQHLPVPRRILRRPVRSDLEMLSGGSSLRAAPAPCAPCSAGAQALQGETACERETC